MFVANLCYAQIDSTSMAKLELEGDFRFRIEQDWNGQRSNGTQINDRSRLRYRLRFGLAYNFNSKNKVGARIRTGKANNQQDPHLTIGDGFGEFSIINLGVEKLFYSYEGKIISFWLGKNSLPLRQNNELFWNDNVFPEGIGINLKVPKIDHQWISEININAGHFIIKSNQASFAQDSYLQVIQADFRLLNNKINLFPSLSYFHQVGNIPDGKHSLLNDYSIFQFGSLFKIDQKEKLSICFDYFANLQDYSDSNLDYLHLSNQKTGYVVGIKYGESKNKGDLLFGLSYARIQKYAIVDYFAQNDWARWDYSSFDASGGRMSNFEGLEFTIKYTISESQNLVMRSFFVEELVTTGLQKEKGSRIRLDFNLKI